MAKLAMSVLFLTCCAGAVLAQSADPAAQPADTTVVVAPPETNDSPPPSDSGGGRRFKFGAGVHYMKTVGSISDEEEFDEDALNLLLAAKMPLGLITVEFDSEWALDYGGSDNTLWMPQVFGLVGQFIYGGVGIGTGYVDGEWFDNPVYTLRAGVNFPLGRFAVDVNANYQFMSSRALENADSDDLDSVTFGAVLWF